MIRILVLLALIPILAGCGGAVTPVALDASSRTLQSGPDYELPPPPPGEEQAEPGQDPSLSSAGDEADAGLDLPPPPPFGDWPNPDSDMPPPPPDMGHADSDDVPPPPPFGF